MPKRLTTPPPGDDEPRYLTIWFPYPAHPNLDEAEERRALVYWVARIMRGSENLFAILYRRVTSNMVIIEVNRSYSGFHYLLGLHSWGDFLANPTKEEQTKESRIFWCTYTTGREAEKYGYKRIMIEDTWFSRSGRYGNEYRRVNARFVDDFPMPIWCELPDADVKDRNLCRPIPYETVVSTFIPDRPPPVGSHAWVEQRSGANDSYKGKERGLRSSNAQYEAPQFAPESVSGRSTPSLPPSVAWSRKSETPRLWLASHPKSGVNGNIRDPDYRDSVSSDSSPHLSPANLLSEESPVVSPLSPESGCRDETDDIPNIADLHLAPSDDPELLGVHASGVIVFPTEPIVPLEHPVYKWEAEDEDTSEKPPLCPHHKAACRKGVCRHYDNMLKDWMRERRGTTLQVQEQTLLDSNYDNDFSRIALPPKRGRGRGRGRARGFRA